MLLVLACFLVVVDSAHAGSVTDAWDVTTVTLTVPDAVEEGVPFDVVATGSISGGSSYNYAIYENATWSYNTSHMVTVTSGTLLESSSLEFGSSFSGSWTRTIAADTSYLFVMGDRSGGHGWYDVAVEVSALVTASPTLCDPAFRGAKRNAGRVGSTIPILFEGWDCETGDLFRDEGVVVSILAEDGTEMERWYRAARPPAGVLFTSSGYHVNWSTVGYASGLYTILVQWSDGQELSKRMYLR